MKNFGKFFLIVAWVTLLLGSGYYLLINNLSSILAAGKPRIVCDCNPSRIRIKTGRWVEVIKLDMPIKIYHRYGIFVFQSGRGTLTVSARPKFTIRWLKRLE